MNEDYRIIEKIILEYKGDETDVVIPFGVEEIGMMAFSYCDQLLSVQIPQTVKIIGHSAFAYCENLEKVTIPDEVEDISGCAFIGCKNLTKLRLPAKYRTPYYISYIFGSDADVEKILAYNKRLVSGDNTEEQYSSLELESMLNELLKKYSREEIPYTIEEIKEDNEGISITAINSLVVRKYGMKLRKYIIEHNEEFRTAVNDSTSTDNLEVSEEISEETMDDLTPLSNSLAMTKENFDEMIATLQNRYKENKATSIIQIIAENKDLDISCFNRFAKLYYGMTRKELFITKGVLAEKHKGLTDNQVLKLGESYIEQLKERYKEHRAQSLTQVFEENPDISQGYFYKYARIKGQRGLKKLLEKEGIIASVQYAFEPIHIETEETILKQNNEPSEEILKGRELDRLELLRKDIPLNVLDLSVRAANCLSGCNYSMMNQLSGLTREDLLAIKNMGRGTAGEIMKKINDFLDDNRALYDESLEIYEAPFIREQIKEQIKDAIQGSNDSFLELSVIGDAIEENVPEHVLEALIEELLENGSVAKNADGKYYANYPSVIEVIENINNGRDRDIVRSYLNGQGPSQIARAYDISKQRVDQIVSRSIDVAVSAVGKVREDTFSYIYTTYNINKEIWIAFIRKPEYVFFYLNIRYERGNKPISDALNDEYVPEEIKVNIRVIIDEPQAIKTGTTEEVEPVINDNPEIETSGIHFPDGELSSVVFYYDTRDESEQDIELYSDKDTFEKRALKLKKRIRREIKRKKYISDIKISDEEYELLKAYLHYAVQVVQTRKIIPDKDLYVVAIVQAAIRVYKDGNFWSNFHQEIQVPQRQQYRHAIGDAFYSVLEEYNLIRVAPNEYVQNILLHCFISNNYAEGYFDFLYAFYRIDLDRDIDRLDRELMNELMTSICAEENDGRTFMLVKHIGQAMAANQRGAKIRIRSHLKLMDRLFWDDQYEIKTDHRIKGLLQSWARQSDRMRTDIEEYRTGRRRGKKQFSHPYIALNEETDSLSIILPAQSIKVYDSDDFNWHIYGETETVVPAEVTESVLGLKVLETDAPIEWGNALDAFKIELKADDTGEVIKTFRIQADSVRLFDDSGYPVNANKIKVGDVIAVSEKDAEIDSNALYDRRIVEGMAVSYFQFEYEDIVKLPDGHAVIVGIKEISNSIAGKGKVEGARCEIDGNEYTLYGKIPYLVLRMKAERANGTSIAINSKRYRLTDCDYKMFSLDDRSDDTGYYMDLAGIIGEAADDLYRIEVDIPNTTRRAWNFVYIRNLEVKFEDAPYVFEPRGTARFPEHIDIKWIEDGCEKETGINAYKFDVQKVNKTIDFITYAGGKEVLVNVQVPAFFMMNEDGIWDSDRPAPIWHSDFPNVIDLIVPYHKVTLYMEEDGSEDGSEDGDTQIREVEYRKKIGETHIECDITRFKSYLTGDNPSKQLSMKFNDIDEALLDIMIHSNVVTCQLIGDFKGNNLIINAVIQGKSQYYADVMKDGIIISEKTPIIDGKATIPCEIENARYDVEIYEAEEDESGFGEEEYYPIGKFNQQLLNPYDMSNKSFKVVRIEKRKSAEETFALRYDYYVEKLEKTDQKNVYEGMMVVEKNLGEVTAVLPVHVLFEDIDKPTFVWITFLDEYNEESFFLYDTKRKGILQEENRRISPLACYRRYTMLDDYEDIFHIEFCEREEHDYDDVDEKIEFPEDTSVFRFTRRNRNHKKKEKQIDDIIWDRAAYAYLQLTGDSTLEQLSDRTKIEFFEITGAPDEIVNRIESIMNFYGYQFAEKSRRQRQSSTPAGMVALPKEHGIRVEDIKWRNARARACLDRAGIFSLDRLATMTKKEFTEQISANDKVITRVEEVMHQYGYRFKSE